MTMETAELIDILIQLEDSRQPFKADIANVDVLAIEKMHLSNTQREHIFTGSPAIPRLGTVPQYEL
ncbi:hypothetical protein NFB56_09370 [Yersinia ruckeri]|uniref:hypothetical protein n=1 Tax=Yersinia ruckeri TaxID=29486 RepID=UPI0020C1157B|nr:hypothetical protein [Yersinia ruckeri]EKN3345966.1 hypothetical protein [Yersinia ruckeri]ELM3745602.1 hypothetical protein [Yersinia ruckeri]MCK8562356.1 hypothetical protein [Yersinia ruckeri]MCW6549065.1 hypothetical protein [Yersinia ruckeri]MCW6633224.1 hypothetical protein [Yersinia ruckeri]